MTTHIRFCATYPQFQIITDVNGDILHCFVLEYCPLTLQNLVTKTGPLRDADAIALLVDMSHALHFLACNNILHRFASSTYFGINRLSIIH